MERQRKREKGQNWRGEIEDRDRNRWKNQEERKRGETGGETEKEKGERELEKKIVEIHTGGI